MTDDKTRQGKHSDTDRGVAARRRLHCEVLHCHCRALRSPLIGRRSCRLQVRVPCLHMAEKA